MKTIPMNGPDQARAVRQKAMAFAMKRKEEYLGARVPKALKDKIIDQARKMDIPVSLLLRKVLEEVFLEQSREHENSLLVSLKAGAEVSVPEQTNRFAAIQDVIGWQKLELSQRASCEVCDAAIAAGNAAYLGRMPAGKTDRLVCETCKLGYQHTR